MQKDTFLISQGSYGHRVAMIMKNTGVVEDDYESFISKLWKRYVSSGLSPDILAEQINRLHFFLETNQNYQGMSLSLSQILQTIKSKQDDIKNLESKEQNLEKMILDSFAQKDTVEAELDWDYELKEKLKKNGFKKQDVPRFVDAALLLKEQGYDIFDIVERFKKVDEIENACISIELKKADAIVEHGRLSMQNQDLEERISRNSLKLRELDKLMALGFGYAEFRILRDIITEVAEDRGIFGNEAVREFFKDLRDHYYDYVQLRKSVSELRAEKARLSSTDYVTNLFQDFLKPSIKTSGGPNPKNNPKTEDNKSEKNVESDDINYGSSAPGAYDESTRDQVLETPDSCAKNQERGDPCNGFYGEKVMSEAQHLRRRDEHPLQKPSPKLQLHLDSSSQGGLKKTEINEDLVVPNVQKNRLPIRPPLPPMLPHLKRLTRSTPVSSSIISSTDLHPAPEVSGSFPNIAHLQDSITSDLLRNMFRDQDDEDPAQSSSG